MEKYFPTPQLLLPWFDQNKRDLPWRKSKDAYAVWVSEIMLQQTRVEAAKGHYIRFMNALPTVFDLASCDDERLMKLWEGLGYYSRARNLKKCAVEVVEKYGGVFPRDKTLLQKLPGIGEYTAGAVSSIAYDEKNPAIDGNVLRVCARVQGDFTPIDNIDRKKELYALLQEVYPDRAGDYTQSLMELGALVCLPDTPRCEACPLVNACKAYLENWQSRLPVMPQKAEKKSSRLTVFVVQTPQGVALCKRQQKGVLGGMWQFPNELGGEIEPLAVTGKKVEDVFKDSQTLQAMGVTDGTITQIKGHTHVFTHLIWEMTAVKIETEQTPLCPLFTKEQIKKEISLPTAFRWCVELL